MPGLAKHMSAKIEYWAFKEQRTGKLLLRGVATSTLPVRYQLISATHYGYSEIVQARFEAIEFGLDVKELRIRTQSSLLLLRP